MPIDGASFPASSDAGFLFAIYEFVHAELQSDCARMEGFAITHHLSRLQLTIAEVSL